MCIRAEQLLCELSTVKSMDLGKKNKQINKKTLDLSSVCQAQSFLKLLSVAGKNKDRM